MEMGFLDTFAMITLGVRQTEEPLFEEVTAEIS